MSLTGLEALLAIMLLTGKIMVLTAIADRMIGPRLSNVFSRMTAIILMVLAMPGFTIKIQIANSALDVHISGLEGYHEWLHLIKPRQPSSYR